MSPAPPRSDPLPEFLVWADPWLAFSLSSLEKPESFLDFLLLVFSHEVTSDSLTTPWTVTCHAPLSMGFPRREYWSRLPFPSPGDLPHPGIEPVSPELWGRLFATVKVLHSICQQIWKTKQWPQDWKRKVFIPIPKTGNVKECSNYHTVILFSHASKEMLKILQARLQQYVN